MSRLNTKKLCQSALFMALGMILPILFGQIKEIGDTLLPMHLPVMLCGIFCGWQYGLSIGLVLPFLRSLIYSMPPLYPNAVWMSIELATYGFVIGILCSHSKKITIPHLYLSLIISMITGRILWGISKAFLLGMSGKSFTFHAFVFSGFVDSLPGIVLQLILIPLVVAMYNKNKYIKTKEV